MQDEYGALDSTGQVYTTNTFLLESGERLIEAKACYNTYGVLNETRDNVIVVCHALTGNSRLDLWWGSLLGPGLAFDTSQYYIICANVLGSCYGSTGPRSIDPSTGQPYGSSLPQLTIRDSVRLHIQLVKEHIGAKQVQCVIGGSMGGMQALEWVLIANGYQFNDDSRSIDETMKGDIIDGHRDGVDDGRDDRASFVKSAVVIGCGTAHTAWQIAISETQRQAIYADPKWNRGDIDFNDGPKAGLSVARQIAMVSYRTACSYRTKFNRDLDPTTGQFEVQNYLLYQGNKFLERFDALTYVRLTQQMDSHDVGRGRGGADRALSTVQCKVLVMGIDSDLLYPLIEQQELAAMIPGSIMKVIHTHNGHDGFLLEQDQVSEGIKALLCSL